MKLIVGLGNPGGQYARNRHNIGFMAVDEIARRWLAGGFRKRFGGEITAVPLNGTDCQLLKPLTFMNDSGRSVGEAMRFFKLEPADLIVFHDELDLDAGRVKVKTGGGNAGHNGLRSITAHIGNDYARVRIGIGHPGAKEAVHGHVLSDFAKADRVWLKPLLEAIAEHAGLLAAGDPSRFLTEFAKATGAEPPKPLKQAREPKSEAAKPASPEKPAIPAAPNEPDKPKNAFAERLKGLFKGSAD